MNNDSLWLFDYSDGIAYENFSKCEDYNKVITNFLYRSYCFFDKTVLEIGAGSGKFTPFLAEASKKLYVVEKSASLMKINQIKNRHFKNVDFILSDTKDINLPEKSIDVIFGGWSLTSMRGSFRVILPVLKKILKNDGMIILIENAGEDQFASIAGISDLTKEMKEFYLSHGFEVKAMLDTEICLPDKDIFYAAFPNKQDVSLESLTIQHKVLILEAQSKFFTL